MKNPFTNTYKITVFQNGKPCWKPEGWTYTGIVITGSEILLYGIIALLILAR